MEAQSDQLLSAFCRKILAAIWELQMVLCHSMDTG